MMKSFQMSEFCNQFYQSFYLSLVQEIFAVMTDGFHKPGFKLHALILQNMFTIAESDQLSAPLWDVAAQGPSAYPSNAAFVKEHVSNLLTSSFPNMGPAESQVLVQGMFDYKKDLTLFKNHLRISSCRRSSSSPRTTAPCSRRSRRRDRRRSVSESRPFPACSPPSQIDMGDD